jgi:hypothetical protein
MVMFGPDRYRDGTSNGHIIISPDTVIIRSEYLQYSERPRVRKGTYYLRDGSTLYRKNINTIEFFNDPRGELIILNVLPIKDKT